MIEQAGPHAASVRPGSLSGAGMLPRGVMLCRNDAMPGAGYTRRAPDSDVDGAPRRRLTAAGSWSRNRAAGRRDIGQSTKLDPPSLVKDPTDPGRCWHEHSGVATPSCQPERRRSARKLRTQRERSRSKVSTVTRDSISALIAMFATAPAARAPRAFWPVSLHAPG